MSQPRRRRRRGRKKPSTSDAPSGQSQQQGQGQREKAPGNGGDNGPRSRRRRGRSRRTGGENRTGSPKLSEDLVRALPRPRPESLMLPPDGQDLEELIGELQSTWGVPQYPQEFRITIRVAEPRDRDRGGDRGQAPQSDAKEAVPQPPADPNAPRREKAPPPQRLADGEAPSGDGGQRKRRSRRRRRGKGPGGAGSGPTQGGGAA